MEASRVGSSWLRKKRGGQKNQPTLYSSAWFMQQSPQIFTGHLLWAARDWEDSYQVGQGKGLWHMGNPYNCLERHFLERKNSSCSLLHDNLFRDLRQQTPLFAYDSVTWVGLSEEGSTLAQVCYAFSGNCTLLGAPLGTCPWGSHL